MSAARTAELRARLLELMRAPDYRALDKVELSKALAWPAEKRSVLKTLLGEMEEEGLITRIRKDRYVLPQAANLVTGVLQVHMNGSAHILSEVRGGPESYVTAENTGVAMHGDTVVAQLIHEGHGEAGRRGMREGQRPARVIRIVKRAHSTIVGTLQSSKNFFYVIADDPRLQQHVYVKPGETPLPRAPRPGDKVVVRLEPWESRHTNPEGEIVEVIGPASAPGVDMLSIIRKYHLPQEFPPEVLREAERIPEEIPEREIAVREDLREQPAITIDPDDAKDFDDAIHVERLKSGWRLSVHIADVSHYVRVGGHLDKEARERGNSTYLVDRVVPMLPERLSNGICSLRPGVDRLTFSAFIDFTSAGRIKAARFARTVIRSAARLTYKQAYAILGGPGAAPAEKKLRGRDGEELAGPTQVTEAIAERVRVAWELASLLRKNRYAAGSLDLDFPEVKVWLDPDGRAERMERIENDISHQLIEECMLAANEVVARELKTVGVPAVYRIHEDPDPDRLNDFREFAATYGYHAGDMSLRQEVQKTLAAIRGAPEEYAIKLQFLKSLKRAVYDTTPLGHYGLAKINYTHFTSPIRRYADLLVHRSLAGILERGSETTKRRKKEAPSSLAELHGTAEHISLTERNSADAEKDSVQLKKMEYFQRQLTARKPDRFRAIVVDVRSYGLVIELPDIMVTGMVHVSALPDDFYVFDPVRLAFNGRRSQRSFQVGDSFPVVIARIEAHKRQMDFAPVDLEEGMVRGRGGKKPPRGTDRPGRKESKRREIEFRRDRGKKRRR